MVITIDTDKDLDKQLKYMYYSACALYNKAELEYEYMEDYTKLMSVYDAIMKIESKW